MASLIYNSAIDYHLLFTVVPMKGAITPVVLP